MVGLGKFALDLITGLLIGMIQESVDYSSLPFFQSRKIERRIEDSVAEVVEPLLPFLEQEKIPKEKQYRLIEVCVEELRPLTNNPARFFEGSLNGEKIFEELYSKRDLPQTVIDDGLKDIYTLLYPRIATLLCKIPAAVKDWENEAWSENYERLDEITTQLHNLFSVVDELASSPSIQADELLSIVRRSLAQKVRLKLDLTGLRADSPLAGKFDDFFVHPAFVRTEEWKEQQETIGSPNDSFSQFSSPHHQTIIYGAPGSGKSTWAKWMQREALTTRWNGISVLIELRHLSGKPLLSLYDLVRETAGKHLAEDLTPQRIGLWLEEKKIIFILDGFDEITPDDRDRVQEWIGDLWEFGRGCPIVVTSRPLTTMHLKFYGGGWEHWWLEPFDESRIIDYILRWHSHTPLLINGNRDVDADKLAASWRSDSTIKPLTGNPLLLSTLLMVHHLDGSLPSGRSQLYRRYVEGMLGLWDDRRKVSASGIQLVPVQKQLIIRGFALKLFLEEKEQLDEPETLEWLKYFLQKNNILLKAPEILDVLQERSGLIVGPGVYSFAHKSLAEYLVAEAVLQGDQRDSSGKRIDRFSLFEHRDDDRWNTVTFLWAGLAPVADIETFIEECIEDEKLALACGILNDQYDRFPKDIRRRLLLQSSYTEKFTHTDVDVGWSITGPNNSKGATFPSFTLRGLGSSLSLHDLITRAITDGTIVWSDENRSKGMWRDLLWWCFSVRPTDIEVWKACLESPWPSTLSLSHLQFGVAYSCFNYAVVKETIDIESVVLAYQKTCPQALGMVPLALISCILHQIGNEDQHSNQSFYNNINKLLNILSYSEKSEVNPDWLLGTSEWNMFFGDNKLNRIDLFAFFINEMEKQVALGRIERNTTFESAIYFVLDLQNHREVLDVSD